MRRRRLLLIFLAVVLLAPFVLPREEVKAETEWQKLERQIREIQLMKKETAANARNIDNQINQVQQQHEDLEEELESIEIEIDKTEKRLFSLEAEIEVVTKDAKEAASQLADAMQRVEDRKDLLHTRVRLMYRKGDVQYLEVLLGSNSFSDFVQRFNALQQIADSDKKILEDNIKDKDTVEAKKIEIDKALTSLEKLYGDVELIKSSLLVKKEDRKVKIASLEIKEQELAEIKDEEEEFLSELAAKESQLLTKQRNIQYNGGVFAWPVPASRRITSDYGYRIDPINGRAAGHKGLDIGRAPGTSTLYGADIVAASDGVVIVASYVSGFGNTVMIDHGSGIWTLYGHIRNGGIFVHVGQEVKKGQKIAEVGSTGRSTGPHLHFEVRKDKVSVNPWNYLK